MTRKIVHLPGTTLTPEVVLHRIQKIDRIKAVTVVIQWDDYTCSTDWSNQKVSELCMASMQLQDDARRVMRGENTGS